MLIELLKPALNVFAFGLGGSSRQEMVTVPRVSEPVTISVGRDEPDEKNPFDWPDDQHEVPLWRRDQEMRADYVGIDLPRYRTGSEFQEAVRLAEHRLLNADMEEIELDFRSRTETLLDPAMQPDDAAEWFVEQLRSRGECGVYTSSELSELYLHVCSDAGLEPTAENFFRAALGQRDDVARQQIGTIKDGKRHRFMQWTIYDTCADEFADEDEAIAA